MQKSNNDKDFSYDQDIKIQTKEITKINYEACQRVKLQNHLIKKEKKELKHDEEKELINNKNKKSQLNKEEVINKVINKAKDEYNYKDDIEIDINSDELKKDKKLNIPQPINSTDESFRSLYNNNNIDCNSISDSNYVYINNKIKIHQKNENENEIKNDKFSESYLNINSNKDKSEFILGNSNNEGKIIFIFII